MLKIFQVRSSFLWGLSFVFCVILAFFLVQPIFSFFNKIELASIDLRFQLRGVRDISNDVVIVDIDSASLSELDSWPWPRHYYGDVIRQLNRMGAKAIGVDIMLDSKSGRGEQEDLELSRALAENQNVVLASKRVVSGTDAFSMTTWNLPIEVLRKVSRYGFVNEFTDGDATVRRTWSVFNSERGNQYSWDVALVSQYDGLDKSGRNRDIQMSPGEIRLGSRRIPTGRDGLMDINFSGGNRHFLTVPFYSVLRNSHLSPGIFKDKIVLIGATDPVLHDFFNTPFGVMAGVEIHANVIETILHGPFIKRAGIVMNSLLTIFFLGLVIVVSTRLKAVRGLLVQVLLFSGYSAFAILSFSLFSFLVIWAFPIVLGLVVYFNLIMIRFVREERQKAQIKNVFQQYVSPSVVDTILKDPSRLKLGGEKRELTVFFSDIRSFTTYSETHTPEEVVEILNEYLDAMTSCIFKWKGTLDKYVGDEIMAVWGAPLDQPDHAELAVRCCWDQLAVLRALQDRWRSEGRDILDFGMGLNTGEMITGNIGSSMHKDYTVIGDAVNLGARLEAETRHYGTPEEPCYLIISEFTYAKVKPIVTVKSLGAVKVKGKNTAVEIYEVLDVR